MNAIFLYNEFECCSTNSGCDSASEEALVQIKEPRVWHHITLLGVQITQSEDGVSDAHEARRSEMWRVARLCWSYGLEGDNKAKEAEQDQRPGLSRLMCFFEKGNGI